eukprot:COSAG02_NODE_18065_length_963_cov_1.284722_1_plen_71_part_01
MPRNFAWRCILGAAYFNDRCGLLFQTCLLVAERILLQYSGPQSTVSAAEHHFCSDTDADADADADEYINEY